MNPNDRIEQQRIINSDPSVPSETITKTVQQGPREVGLSPATIIVIAILAILAIGVVFYVVNNRNENEAANRDATLESTRLQAEVQARAQQSAAAAAAAQKSQPPVIIQQPMATQAPPVIVQQAAPPTDTRNVMDDSTMQELATKRLADESDLSAISVSVLDGKATLRGTVDAANLKSKAEKIVRSVRGVKSVENTITVSSN